MNFNDITQRGVEYFGSEPKKAFNRGDTANGLKNTLFAVGSFAAFVTKEVIKARR